MKLLVMVLILILIIAVVSVWYIYPLINLNTDFAFRFKNTDGYVKCNNTQDCSTCWCERSDVKIDLDLTCSRWEFKTPCTDLSQRRVDSVCRIQVPFEMTFILDGVETTKSLRIPCATGGETVYKFSKELEDGTHNYVLGVNVLGKETDESTKNFIVTI